MARRSPRLWTEVWTESSCPYEVQKQSCSEVSTSWSLLSWPGNLSTMLMWFRCCLQNPVGSRQSVKGEIGFNFRASWDRSRGYWASTSIVQGREDPVAEIGKLNLDAYHAKINKNPQHRNFTKKKKKKFGDTFIFFLISISVDKLAVNNTLCLIKAVKRTMDWNYLVLLFAGWRTMASFSNLTIGIALASFTTFQLLFHVLSSWLSTRITPGFNNLSQKRKIEWNSR